jgi:hypothetical protein
VPGQGSKPLYQDQIPQNIGTKYARFVKTSHSFLFILNLKRLKKISVEYLTEFDKRKMKKGDANIAPFAC